MHLANYLGYLHKAELHLAEAFRKVGEGHAAEADVYHTCNTLAKQCEAHAEMLGPFVERYDEEKPTEPDRLYHEFFDETRSGGLGLLRDMQDLYLMAHACDIAWTMIGQAAQGAADRELLKVVDSCEGQTATQIQVAQDEDEAGRSSGAPGGILTAENGCHGNGANILEPLEAKFAELLFYVHWCKA